MDIKIVMYLVIEAFAIVIAWHIVGYAWERLLLWRQDRQIKQAAKRLMKLLKDAADSAGRENETALEEQMENTVPEKSEFPTPSPTPEADPFQKKPRGYKLHDGKPCTLPIGTVVDVIRRNGAKNRSTISYIHSRSTSTWNHNGREPEFDVIWWKLAPKKRTPKSSKSKRTKKPRK